MTRIARVQEAFELFGEGTARDVADDCGCSLKIAHAMLSTLVKRGVVERVGLVRFPLACGRSQVLFSKRKVSAA